MWSHLLSGRQHRSHYILAFRVGTWHRQPAPGLGHIAADTPVRPLVSNEDDRQIRRTGVRSRARLGGAAVALADECAVQASRRFEFFLGVA